MTVSMRVMSAGHGYRYLLSSIAVDDDDAPRPAAMALTDYYAQQGTPSGRWLGRGLTGLGDGGLTVGDQVTETQLARLIGAGQDPVTGTHRWAVPTPPTGPSATGR